MAFEPKTDWIDYDPLDPSNPNAIPKASDMNNIGKNIKLQNLFNSMISSDKYAGVKFDVPAVGNITQEIRLNSDDSLYATLVTEFDTPTEGDITTTLLCADLGVHTKTVTEFDTIDGYDVKTTGSVIV